MKQPDELVPHDPSHFDSSYDIISDIALREHWANDPDSAFYFDLKAKCATYSAFVRPACYSLAWTYYEAVHNFGSVVIGADELQRAAAYKAQLVRQARGSD